MKKRAAVKGRKQEENPVAMSVAMQQLMLPLLLAMDATKKGLLSFVQQMGMVVLSELLAAQAAQIAGPKGKHIPLRQDSCRLLETRLWGRAGLRDDRVQRRLSSTDGREDDGPETDVGERAGAGGRHQSADAVAVVARRGYGRGRVQEEGESEAVAA